VLLRARGKNSAGRPLARGLLLFLLACSAALAGRAFGQEVGPETLADLRSRDVDRILRAARTIAQSRNDRAWEALRSELAKSETYEPFERIGRSRIGTVSIEGQPLEITYRELAELFEVIAKSKSPRTAPTLMWLVDNIEENRDLRLRRYFLCASFVHVRSVSPDILGFIDKRLQFKAMETGAQGALALSLASYGTEASAVIFKKHLGGAGTHLMLAAYRQKLENTKLLLSNLREASDHAFFHKALGYIIKDEPIYWMPMGPPTELPLIEPKGKEARRFAALFRDFLANPGKIALTKAEKAKLKELIERCERAAETTPSPESDTGESSPSPGNGTGRPSASPRPPGNNRTGPPQGSETTPGAAPSRWPLVAAVGTAAFLAALAAALIFRRRRA